MTFGQAFDKIRDGKGAMRLPKWSPDVAIKAELFDVTWEVID